jgi:SprT-like family.
MKPEEIQIIHRYFPEKAVNKVVATYDVLKFNLTFTGPRSSKLGDFRSPRSQTGLCKITLNSNLNQYQMLITFVHEVAHLLVFRKYGFKAQPHGVEWKKTYAEQLQVYLDLDIFPPDLATQIRQHLNNIKSSTCTDIELTRLLKRYEEGTRRRTVEEMPENAIFRTPNGLLLQKGPKLRKNFKCQCLQNKRWYIVNPLLEVESCEH